VQEIQEAHRAEHHSAASLIAESGAVIKQGKPSFAPSEDVIRMPHQESFDTLDDYYATALHEPSHWSGHQSRLNRDMTDRFGNQSYAMEELIAELSSAFLSAKCGIEGKLQHAEYLNSWVKVLKSDNRAIFAAASKAREASEFIQELVLEYKNQLNL